MKKLILLIILETLLSSYELSPTIIGATFQNSASGSLRDGTLEVSADSAVIILFGTTLDGARSAALSHTAGSADSDCTDSKFPVTYPLTVNTTASYARMRYNHSPLVPQDTLLYLCVGVEEGETTTFLHQSSTVRLIIVTSYKLIPMWLSILISAILILLSGLFSGLNLGLMSLTPRELKLISSTGTPSEKKNAKAVLPLRKKGNILLCAILFGNTIVNTTVAIMLESLTSGLIAVAITTLTIVILGEVIPQSICARYGLLIGAKTRYFTWAVIVITFPVSYPLGKLLDLIIGHETPVVYNRQQLLEVVRLNCEGNLEADEAGIIFGALKFKSKNVMEIMTPLDQCYMVGEKCILDFETISEIMKSGYSRIPVYSGSPENVVALLHIKDLAFIDPDDMIPITSVLSFYNHPIIKVFFDTKLDLVFNEFKKGLAHLGIVVRVSQDDSEPPYVAIGIVTLEDIIEEIIQSEISDETDTKLPVSPGPNIELSMNINKYSIRKFFDTPQNAVSELTSNMLLTICQFLSTALKSFSPELVSLNVLRRLISHPGVATRRPFSQNYYLYKIGVPADYFVLLIEGRVEVTVGSDNLVFTQGPFSYFGLTFLEQLGSTSPKSVSEKQRAIFTPDFSVKILSTVVFIKINYSNYILAVKATQLEKSRTYNSEMDDAWDKVAVDTPYTSVSIEPLPDPTSPNVIIIKNKPDFPPHSST